MATRTTTKQAPHARRSWWQQVVLGCGIVAPALWGAMDVVSSLRYPGYNYIHQTISELSTEGAPTRIFMTVLRLIPYVVLMIAFGLGVWRVTGGRRAGRVTGALLVVAAVWGGVGGLAFPMATREVIAARRHGWGLRSGSLPTQRCSGSWRWPLACYVLRVPSPRNNGRSRR